MQRSVHPRWWITDTTVSDKRQQQPGVVDTGDHARVPITLIFDHFWAKLQARLQPEAPCQNLHTRVRADGRRVTGGPPQGIQDPRFKLPHPRPSRAESNTEGAPQRCWPHRQSAAKRTPKRPDMTTNLLGSLASHT
ncbi:Hypothetical predicted protein [Pelobates cultripes]|uniref:Uncharacterized protein n=1 Tax=Pelobates cultripes TaxID=61616 RepID=A0AAD1WUM7_PELCU|nr:Hypothetical predicted protein [Pelobates cultripes]